MAVVEVTILCDMAIATSVEFEGESNTFCSNLDYILFERATCHWSSEAGWTPLLKDASTVSQ
jgi:hypothetical protein